MMMMINVHDQQDMRIFRLLLACEKSSAVTPEFKDELIDLKKRLSSMTVSEGKISPDGMLCHEVLYLEINLNFILSCDTPEKEEKK